MLLCLPFAGSAGAQTYSVSPLEPLSTGFSNFSTAVDINTHGIVLGEGSGPFTTQVVHVWFPGDPTPTPHYVYGFNQTYPGGINDEGDVVGAVRTGLTSVHGFINQIDLGIGAARDVNKHGQVVGFRRDTTGVNRRVYRYQDGEIVDSVFTDSCLAELVAINDLGVAAGWYDSSCLGNNNSRVAALYTLGSLVPIGHLGGGFAEATDINNRGQVVGWSFTVSDGSEVRGFLWYGGEWTTIPTLGGTSSRAQAINDLGVVVGTAQAGPSDDRAFIFDTVQGLRDLNTMIPPGSGWTLRGAGGINAFGEIVGIGEYNGLARAFLLTPPPNRFFELRDEFGTPLADQAVEVFEVSDFAPIYVEVRLLADTTDANGQIGIPRQLAATDQTYVIRTKVHTEPAVKGTAHRSGLYTIHLDNMRIDSTGAVSFDSLRTDSIQIVTMDHTIIAFNLIVSVEWDAEEAYLSNLRGGLSWASHYLFDVTDGQARFDTVFVFDNREAWDDADVHILATNSLRPRSGTADRTAGGGAFGTGLEEPVRFPRIYYQYSNLANIEADWTLYPYDWRIAATNYDPDGSGPEPPLTLRHPPVRTLVHELGHYLFGFRDEYEDTLGNPVWDTYNFGMMDDQLDVDVQASELSCTWQYQAVDMQVTEQWQRRGGASCWEWFQQVMGEVHGNIFCPITAPDESNTPTRMVVGPNDDLQQLDYILPIVFPVVHTPPSAATKTILVTMAEQSSLPVAGAKVTVRRNLGGGSDIRLIEQGYTNAAGQIRVVGFAGGAPDDITASDGFVRLTGGPATAASPSTGFEWLFGEGEWGSTPDEVVIASRAVAGHFPMILRLEPQSTQAATFVSETDSQLPGGLHLWLYDDDGTPQETTPQTSGPKALVPWDSLGEAGDFDFSADDTLGYRFRIPSSFVRAAIRPGRPNTVFSAEGGAELTLDSLSSSSSLDLVSLLSTPYPAVRTGLTDANVQVSHAHHVASWPPGPFAGAAILEISYEDADLGADAEATIRMFAWDTLGRAWNQVGGTVDERTDEVASAIAGGGVYALFTVYTPTNTEEPFRGVLPGEFELEQNIPNPFNPATTIGFSIPAAAGVRLEVFNILGRRVRVLLDEIRNAGRYRVEWNGLDESGAPAPTGVYLYRLQSAGHTQVMKMVLLR